MFKHLIFDFSACNAYTYGHSCMKTCGSCFYNEQCNKANGECSKGCNNNSEKVYISPLCQTSNNLLYNT